MVGDLMASGKRTATAVTLGVLVLALVGVGVLASSGGAKPAPPPVDKPVDEPPPEPADVPPGSLAFDLKSNWGVIPLSLRIWLARIELAAQIPGLARALAVKAWQAFRAGQPIVDLLEAASIAEKNPELCRQCFNPLDGPASKVQIDKNIAGGWPKPKDYDGWIAGSFGLFDILGASAVWAGIMTGKSLPLINLNAAEAMRRYDVQGFVAAAIIRQFLFSEKYSVLVPGANAVNGNSKQTWTNIFAAWAQPDNFAKGLQSAKDAGERYAARAAECGIDLAQVAYPWPPGQKYDVKNWTAQAVWQRLQEYKNRPVNDQDVVVPPLPDVEEGGQDNVPHFGLLEDVGGGLKAVAQLQIADPKIPAPLVVVLHGREGKETQLQPFVPPDLGARVFFVRGNLSGPGGTWSFFEPRLADPEAVLLPAMKTALNSVLAALAQLQAKYPTTRVVVLGGSQGAALAYALAAAGAVDAAIGISGMLPPALRPVHPAASIVYGIHGSADKVVPIADGAATVEAFKAAGYLFTRWRSIAGGGHSLTQAKGEVQTWLGELIGKDFIAPEVGLALTEACQVVVPSPADAAWSLSQRLVTLARTARATSGAPLKKVDLDALIDALIIEIAPFCALGGREWADATAALEGYFVFRAALRSLQGRGLLVPGVAAQVLGDFRQQALTIGVPAGALTPFDL